MPGDVQFSSKADLARLMLGRALDAGVPASWVTADEAYGKEGKFREWLEQRRVSYVVAVPKSQAVAGDAGKSRADVLTAHAPDQAWKRRSCGNGSKGARVYDWAAATLPEDGTEPPGWQRFLVVRRSLTPNSKGELELAYYLCAAPAGTEDEELIRVAGARWAVEEDFEFGKDCFALDQSQVRLYTAILRHTVLVMAALAICAVTAALLKDRTDTQAPPPHWPGQPPPAEPGMIPLTIPEIKRLLAALTTRPLPPWHVIHWHAWTRRHQARSRWFHQRARLAHDAENSLVSQ